MKTKHLTTTLFTAALAFTTSCGEKNNGHSGHDRSKGEEHDDHNEGEDHDDHDHAGHDHIKSGPKGGRMIKDANAEFYVTPARIIQITFFDENNNPITPTDQEVVVVSGDRRSPVDFTFTTEGKHLVSNQKLPLGSNHPTAIEITSTDKTAESKFNLDLTECSSCYNKEYACECHH